MGIWGYKVLQETDWTPWYLGGSGSFENSIVNMPFTPCPRNVYSYGLVFLGLYTFQLIDLIIEGKKERPDFHETLVHHLCAAALTGGMLMTNNRGVGILTAYIHIWADIPVQFARIFSSTYYVKTSAVSLIVLIIVWVWTRVFILAHVIWGVWFLMEYPAKISHFNIFKHIFAIFSTSLFSLHIYWTVLLFRMIISFLKTGTATDLQMQVKKKSE